MDPVPGDALVLGIVATLATAKVGTGIGRGIGEKIGEIFEDEKAYWE